MRPKSIAICHPQRRHCSKGLCQSCWKKQDRKKNPTKYKQIAQQEKAARKKRDAGKIPACHPERKYYSSGLCAGCCNARYRKRYPEKFAKDSAKTNARQLAKGYWKKYYRTHRATLSFEERKFLLIFQKYRLTKERFHEMYEEQNQLCKVCRNPLPYEKIQVDHNHKTKQVRGLLCLPCNMFVGRVEKHPLLAHMALDYLLQTNSLTLPVVLGNSVVENAAYI